MVIRSAILVLSALLLHPAGDGFKRERGDAARDAVKDAAEGKVPPELKATNWLNTPGQKALAWKELQGKVVLIDLWAYW